MPTHLISGSLGTTGIGAIVFFVETITGYNAQQGTPATADGNGNYTSGPLTSNATYKVIPVLFGKEFSPFSQTVILGTSDITGINWSGTSSAYTLTSEVTDSFNRGGITQNPIIGWTTLSSDNDIQSVSNTAQAITGGDVSGAYKTGYTPSADCYIQISPSVLSDSDLITLKGRTDASGQTSGFQLEFLAGLGIPNDAGFQIIDIIANASSGALFSSPGFIDEQTLIYQVDANDVLTFVIRGMNMYAFLNGTPVGAGTSTNTPSAGFTGFEILTNIDVNEAQMINFAGGAVTTVIPSTSGSSEASIELNWINMLNWLRQI
jgi:hypothetical protein